MLQAPTGARTRVQRRIAADPTSTALLLAAPTAVDLWPGVRRVDEDGGRLVVEAEPLPCDPSGEPAAVVTLRALPPRRTPTAYVTRFEWTGGPLPAVSGRLTLAYAPTGTGASGTHAVLELTSSGDGPCGPGALVAMAEGFLGNLARAAETRNRAA